MFKAKIQPSLVYGAFYTYFSHFLLIGSIIYINSEKHIKIWLRCEKHSQTVL